MLLSLIITTPAMAQELESVGSEAALDAPTTSSTTQSVVGGSAVSSGDWPDTAAIYFGNQVGCTGVLIAPNAVLSAGHCADGITAVKLNTNDYSSGGERIMVAEIIEYPDSQRTFDLAVLILESDATAEPRVIARGCALEDLDADAQVTVVGYGAQNPQGTQYNSTLMEGFTTVDDPECTDFSSGCVRDISPGGELGAGASDEVDSCYGDSGGPLYLTTDHGDYLVGITSRGYNTSWDCGGGGIYVRPDAVIDWLEESIGDTLPTPDCDGDGGGEPGGGEPDGGDDSGDGADGGGGGGGGGGESDEMWVTGCSHAPGGTGWMVVLLALVAPLIRRR
ncbi:MAG: trypsin [Myxococcota bacterium]|jgi:trypsin